MPRKKHSWYQIVKKRDPLQQGDFILQCPVIITPEEIREDMSEVSVNISQYNAVVMSQSCDLEARKIDLVLLCPFYSLDKIAVMNSAYSSTKGKNLLREGHVVGYHLLNKCELKEYKRGFIVVDFKNVFSIPIEALERIAVSRGNRIRLLPPYREHLSQAFARFFMRVGLPVDIPSFKTKRSK